VLVDRHSELRLHPLGDVIRNLTHRDSPPFALASYSTRAVRGGG
jgi:hypothetical protein